MSKKIYLALTGTIFAIVAILHLLRLINLWPVQVGAISIPIWLSCVALLIASVLCVWAFLLLRKP